MPQEGAISHGDGGAQSLGPGATGGRWWQQLQEPPCKVTRALRDELPMTGRDGSGHQLAVLPSPQAHSVHLCALRPECRSSSLETVQVQEKNRYGPPAPETGIVDISAFFSSVSSLSSLFFP